MIAALRDLDGEGLFGNEDRREGVVVFVSISDAADARKVETESAHELNSQSVYRRFRSRYENR